MILAHHPAVEIAKAFVMAATVEGVTLTLAMLPVWRCPPDAPWPERARRSWTARILIGAGPIILAAMFGIECLQLEAAPWFLAATVLAALLGGLMVSVPVLQQILRRPMSLGVVANDWAISFLVRSPALLVFLIMFGLLWGQPLGWTSAGIMAGAFALALLFTLGLGLKMARALRLLTPAPERLRRLAAACAERAGQPAPRVELVRWNFANALAFPFAGTVAFTEVTLALLDDQELEAVLAHELAHLAEGPHQKSIRLSGFLVLFPTFSYPVWVHRFGPWALPVVALIGFLGTRFLLAFTRRMEQRADAAAHGENPPNLARALSKIYEYNLMPAVLPGQRRTHPDLYDRMLAAGLEPPYPRPAPPARLPPVLLLLWLMAMTVGLIFLAHPRAPKAPPHRGQLQATSRSAMAGTGTSCGSGASAIR